MQRKSFVRVISWLLCLAMMVGMMPVIAMAAEEGLVLHYDFESLENGTIVEDISGNGKAAEVMPRGSGVLTEDVEIYGREMTAIVLAGGQPGEGQNYVEMPVGVLNDLESVTISCWVYVNQSVSYGRIWDFGSNTTSYMYLLDNGYNDGHTGYTAAITNSGWSNEQGPEKGSALKTREWKLTTVTFDGETNTMTLYEDGVEIDSYKTTVGLSVLNGSKQNWIGYGQFKDDMFNGMVADFRIYDYAMSEDEVAGLFEIPDEERVERDHASLNLGNTTALTQNLTLPETGAAGSEIEWISDDEGIITNKGVITRPKAGEDNATTTLTAHISSGDAWMDKVFTITVLALPTDQQRVDADAASINLGNLNAVTENLKLPSTGPEGTVIEWAAEEGQDYLTNDGKVTRPVGDPVTVKLTATVTCGDAKTTREFDVTIMPRYEKLDAVKAETVEVTTKVGIAPSLPAVVKATFENGTTGMVKVTWPTNMDGANYAQEGTKTVTGKLVDHDVTVTANVTIAADVETPDAMAELLDLSDVTLDGDDSIYGQNMGRALEYLKVMDADRMLYNFRRTFGQDTKGARALTGWDEPTGLLRGHSTGHFMSALAQAYASTGDEEYKEKLDYMIEEMRALQLLSQGVASEFETECTPSNAAQSKWSTDPSTWGEGFISAYSPDQFALLEQYTTYATIWAPYYTLHKLLAGFLDSYVYAGNETGLEIAVDLGLWVHDRLSACTQEQRTRMWAMYIAGEYGGMNEVLARLYEITGDERLLEASLMFDNTVFFNGLAENEDTIQTRHANQHIPQIVGAIHEYAATGDPFYYNVAQHFWEMATARYAYSIGGVGTGESFKQPYKQGANINGNSSRGENCETCAAYNLLKLTRNLYVYDPDNAEYMDYYERTVLNQIAASQSHNSTSSMHNGVTYMLPIDPGQRRTYDSDYGGFTCCNGTGMENHVIYQIATYAKTADTLYVNLYMPSTAEWEEKGISVKQETQFPSENVKLTVSGSGEFKMKLRVPYWATAGYTVKVNGEVICTAPTPSSYVEIDRAWADGDVVEINMPYTLYLDKTPDTVNGSVVASLMYGPIVMVAKDTRSSYTAMNWYSLFLNDNNLEGAVTIAEPAGTGNVPHLVVEGLDFYPMYDAYNYRYHAYVKLMEAESMLNPEYLQAAVAAVTGENAPSENAFTPEDWQAFQTALSAAQALLEKEDATQLELYEAEVALEEAAAKKSEVPNDFTAVSQITGVPTAANAGEALTLTGTVEPADATNQTIVWSVKDAGETGAVIEGDVLTATAAGTVVVTATVANGAAEDQDYTQDITITVNAVIADDEDEIAKAVEAAQAAAAAAKAAADEAKAAAEEAAAYVAEDMSAAEAAAQEAAIAAAAAEAAQAAFEAAKAAADAETAKAAAAKAEEAAKAAIAAAANAKANAAKQATVQKLEAALKVIKEATEAAEAAKAAAKAAQEAAEEAAASAAQDKTAAAAALEAAEAAKLAAEKAAKIAAEAREKAEAAEYDAAIAAAGAAASAAEAANSAAETAKAQAVAQSACEKAENAQKAAEAAQEAAEEAAASAAQDKTAAAAALKAAEAAKLAAENAAAIAAEAREKAEAADFEAAVAAAGAAASAAEAANSAAETAKAQAIAQSAREKAEDAQIAAEAAQKKADEAAAKGEVAAEEAINAQKAADDAKKEAEKAEAAAKASAAAAAVANAKAARDAAEAAENAAAIAAALKEVAQAQAEIAEAKERALAAAEETEAVRKKAEEALAAAEAAALGAVKNFAVSQVVVLASTVPDADLKVVMDSLTAIEAAESIAEVNAVLDDVMKALGLGDEDVDDDEFIDMPAEGNWAYEGIDYCVTNGLMQGVGEGMFNPTGTLTRAELVTILYRAAGEPEVEFKGVFTDVADNKWFSDAIEWAAANKIVNGVGEGKFDPAGNITREQIATILYRYAAYKDYDVTAGEDTNILSYEDADSISGYAAAALQYVVATGVMTGKTNTTLNPKDNATRAEIATILFRFLEANK